MNKPGVILETERTLEYCSCGTEEGSIHKDGKKETDWKNDFKNTESTAVGWNKGQGGI